MGIIAGLATVVGVAADFVAQTASIAINLAQIGFDLLSNFVHYTIQIVQSLLNYQQQQPVTFILIVGIPLMLLILAPFITGVNYNHLFFGYVTTYVANQSATPSTLINFTGDEINYVHIAKRNMSYITVAPKINRRDAVMFFGSPDLLQRATGAITTTGTQPVDAFLYGNFEASSIAFGDYRFEECGKLVTNASNSTVWEMKILPVNPNIAQRIRASSANPKLRLMNFTVECWEVALDDTSETVLPGVNSSEKQRSLQEMIANGSICPDNPLESFQRIVEVPRAGGLSGYFVPIAVLYGAMTNLFNSLFNIQDITTMECYFLVNTQNRERIYAVSPTWLGNNSLGANLLYGTTTINTQPLSNDDLASLGAISMPVTIDSKLGLIDAPLVPYRLLKETTNKVTADATKDYFDWFEDAVVILIMLLLGLIGVAFILNTQKINLRK